MRIRLFNARILTMEEGREIFFGEIHVQDDRIVAVTDYAASGIPFKKGSEGVKNTAKTDAAGADGEETGESAENSRWDQEIDCEGNLLMPGFKDAHTHSPMTFLRSYADDLPLQEWLNRKVFPMEAKLDEESVYQFGRLAVLEYLTSGITGIFDMYIMPDVMARAAMDTGMRCVLVSGLNDFTSSVSELEEEYLRLNWMHPLISFQLGCHAEYTCSRGLLQNLAGLSEKLHAPVYLHLAETQKEVRECEVRYGMTPTQFLDSLGLFENGGGGYHCVYLTQEDREIFQKRGLYVITNPASNLKLASGIAPIAEYERQGIPVAIGTDGPASNNCLDMFREMFLVSGLAKYREKDAAALDAERVLRMATVNGALAMGLRDGDVLAAGKLADLILIDLKQPNMQPIHNIPKNLVYSGSKSNVALTMVGGKVLYRGGEFFVGEAPENIYAECRKRLDRLLWG